MKLVYLETAAEDLADCRNYYLEARGRVAAERVLREIQHVCRLLRDNHRIGRLRPKLKENLRSYPSGKFIIYYFADEVAGEIVIVRVLHGARDTTETDFSLET